MLAVQAEREADDLHSLREWLVAEDLLRGRVRAVRPIPDPGTLGSVVETLAVMLGPGGVATAIASVLITWLRRRTGNVKVQVTAPDGSSMELSATNVRNVDAATLEKLTNQLSASLGNERQALE
ncbi:effector-associated constant component EACC1 [Longispora albida]|uniref:effector-associated constant component EACC1 n=1 Tax=Longispora albida TaxID=203523 RepID=UPI000377117E|nr:hypothetical protein [Longispora albida]